MQQFRRTIAMAVLVTGLMAVSQASPAADYKWRMATAVAENSYFYNEFVVRFVNYAKALTDGKVEITPYGAGVIAPAFKVYDAVMDGLSEVGHSSPGYLTN